MSNADIISSAFHEAGHFVFASSQLQTPDCMEMVYDAAQSRWIGKTKLPHTGHLTIENRFVICFGYCLSGCFAQVKHAVQRVSPQTSIPWHVVSGWMHSESGKPLRLTLSDGQIVRAPVYWIDEHDAAVWKEAAGVAQSSLPDWESYGQYVGQAYEEIIRVMEDVVEWDKIEKLAVMLASSIHRQQARVDADQIPRW